MKPVSGTYKFTVQPGGFTVTYIIDAAGCHTTFGLLLWEEAGDCYRLHDIALRFVDGSTFVGVNGPDNFTGTYVKVG